MQPLISILFRLCHPFFNGYNRWVYYVVLIPDGCNRCLKFFNIIHFWFFCLFLFVTIFILGEFACLLQISTNKSGWPLLFTVESRIRSSIIFFIILFFTKFLQKIHFQVMNHQYSNSFCWYHLYSLLYVKRVDTFCVDFLSLYTLDNHLELFFWYWLFLVSVPLFESKQMVFPFCCYFEGCVFIWCNTC